MDLRKLLHAFFGFLFCWAGTVHAGPWLVGQQPIHYTSPHVLGDGSNSRGGEAPYYSSGEPNDIPTPNTFFAQFTGSISGTTLTVSGTVAGGAIQIGENVSGPGVASGTKITAGSGTSWTVNNSQTVASETLSVGWAIGCSPTDLGTTCGEFHDAAHGGGEAKARFDCNVSFHEANDPLLFPGVANGSPHDHSFFGYLGYQGHAQDITYSGLRNGSGGGASAGYSTCYGGPMNRTLYWEPTVIVPVNGVLDGIVPFTVVTYYICGDSISDTSFGPPNCSRWPRALDMIFGFNTSDPNDNAGHNRVPTGYAYVWNGVSGWYCSNPATPSYTSYAPNQTQGAKQPYFNDGNGHNTLNCNVTKQDGVTSCSLGTPNCGYVVVADLSSAECWDGKNPTSPDERSHLIQRIRDISSGRKVCPDNWYLIPHFEAKPEFLFTSLTEMQQGYLSSDRMPGKTQFAGGQSIHADLLPAWGYGTGDNPDFMLRFFQHCLGLSMHVKNSDGVTYTDLTGDVHECGYGRIDATTNAIVNGAPPDGLGPNPVVSLTPDQTGAKRYFPLSSGTALPNTVLHQLHN